MAEPFTSSPIKIANRWRPLTPQEESVAFTLLADAETVLRSRLSDIAARVTAGTLSAAAVVRVQVAMVLRVLRNPDGKRQEAIDDYSWTRDNALSAGLLYVTADELAELLPTRTRSRSVVLQTHSTYR